MTDTKTKNKDKGKADELIMMIWIGRQKNRWVYRMRERHKNGKVLFLFVLDSQVGFVEWMKFWLMVEQNQNKTLNFLLGDKTVNRWSPPSFGKEIKKNLSKSYS